MGASRQDRAVDELQRAIESLAPAGVRIGCRLIALGDEAALLPEEAASIRTAHGPARRASGAARIVARWLLAQLGCAAVAIPKGGAGEPLWPAGVTGSLAHDGEVAVAAVTLRRDVAIGIDVEPAEALPADMLDLVATPDERRRLDRFGGRVLFAAKEAVYKAAFPGDRVFLEFHDIAVDLAAGAAQTRTGRAFALHACVAPRIVVLALARPEDRD